MTVVTGRAIIVPLEHHLPLPYHPYHFTLPTMTVVTGRALYHLTTTVNKNKKILNGCLLHLVITILVVCEMMQDLSKCWCRGPKIAHMCVIYALTAIFDPKHSLSVRHYDPTIFRCIQRFKFKAAFTTCEADDAHLWERVEWLLAALASDFPLPLSVETQNIVQLVASIQFTKVSTRSTTKTADRLDIVIEEISASSSKRSYSDAATL
jgi:hypothetical protein